MFLSLAVLLFFVEVLRIDQSPAQRSLKVRRGTFVSRSDSSYPPSSPSTLHPPASTCTPHTGSPVGTSPAWMTHWLFFFFCCCVCFHLSVCGCVFVLLCNVHTHTRIHQGRRGRVKREIDFSKKSRQPSPAERLRCFLHSTQLSQQITDTCWLVFSLVAKDPSGILIAAGVELRDWLYTLTAIVHPRHNKKRSGSPFFFFFLLFLTFNQTPSA